MMSKSDYRNMTRIRTSKYDYRSPLKLLGNAALYGAWTVYVLLFFYR